MRAYYNEIDPYCVLWLRNLIAKGHIAPGDVDERPIEQVTPADLKGYTQCHFFAGLGGWSRALRLAGWADERPVWTGSCPCQPYSAAGKGLGESDARNLWPVWHALIGQCRPGVVIGEQVDSAIRFGWIDGVRADLEAQDYAAWHTVLPAACAGAPQIRHRLWWVAVAGSTQRERRSSEQGSSQPHARERIEETINDQRGGTVGGLAGADGGNACDGDEQRSREQRFFAQDGGTGNRESGIGSRESGDSRFATPDSRDTRRLARAESGGLGIDGRAPGECGHVDERGTAGGLGESERGTAKRQRFDVAGTPGTREEESRQQWLRIDAGNASDARGVGHAARDKQRHSMSREHGQGEPAGRSSRIVSPCLTLSKSPGLSFWSQYDLIPCADGKARRVEPGTFPLAHGVPARVGKLRAYGNAIEPQTAASFIELFKDVI